jgi:lysophospholipase L1-like esterase
MAAVPAQAQHLPRDVDLAVLSVGGNDAMEHVDLLQQPAQSSGQTLDALTAMADEFAANYDRVAKSVRDRAPRLVLTTIYEPPLVGKNTASRARVLLTLLNDHVLRTAYRLGMDVLDLRAICTSPGDFSLQIQPSAAGAAKIAKAIAAVAAGTGGRRITVIAG